MVNLRALILSFSTIYFLAASNNLAFGLETNAKYAYLMDYNTGCSLFEKDAEEKMVPSSMTKIMTAYEVFKQLNDGYFTLNDELYVSEGAWATGGTKMFVDIHSTIKVHDLLKGVIVQSGNDACKVLAEGISGDEGTFAEKMNEHAKEIGMKNTHFKNSSGLHEEGHYSSAKDLALLSATVIKEFPQYYPYFAETEFTYNKIRQYNKNTLLGKRGVDGLKTGHTDAGGYGIVTSALRDGRRIIVVVNGLKSEKERIVEAEKLLNYGFNNFSNKKLFDANQTIAPVDVWYGNKDKVLVATAKDIEVVVPKNMNKKSEFAVKVVYNSPVKAPIKQGDAIAKLVVEVNGRELATQELIAQEGIGEANMLERGMQNFKYYLGSKFSGRNHLNSNDAVLVD